MGSSTWALGPAFRFTRLPVESRMLNSAKVTGTSKDGVAPPETRLPGKASRSLVGSSGVIDTIRLVSVVSRLLGARMTAYGPASVFCDSVLALATLYDWS